jgi:hypothetical protein
MSTKTVYIASPITLYDTPAYAEIEKLVKRLYPEDTLLFAKGRYPSAADWRREWPMLCPTIDLLLFFDHEGWIGKGVYAEARDVLKRGKDVFYVQPDGTQHWVNNLPWEMDSPRANMGTVPYTLLAGDDIALTINEQDWGRYAFVDVLIDRQDLRAQLEQGGGVTAKILWVSQKAGCGHEVIFPIALDNPPPGMARIVLSGCSQCEKVYAMVLVEEYLLPVPITTGVAQSIEALQEPWLTYSDSDGDEWIYKQVQTSTLADPDYEGMSLRLLLGEFTLGRGWIGQRSEEA